MNYHETLTQMLSAAATAARGQWNALRGYAHEEFERVAEAGAWIEADYLADIAEAQQQGDASRRCALEAKAKARAELALDTLKLAAERVLVAAVADAKLAAQDAVNAAIGVLRSAINRSIGVPIF